MASTAEQADDLLAAARDVVAQRYRANDPQRMTALLRAAREELTKNAPLWNFVQGNLIDENSSLRATNRILLVGLLASLVLVAGAVIAVLHFIQPRYLFFPTDSKTGRVVGQPISSTYVPKDASSAEVYSRILQFMPACFGASLQRTTNLSNNALCDTFFDATSQRTLGIWRTNDNGARDPFNLARHGQYLDITVNVAGVQQVNGTWIVPWTGTYKDAAGHTVSVENQSAKFDVVPIPARHSPVNPFGITVENLQLDAAGAVQQQ